MDFAGKFNTLDNIGLDNTSTAIGMESFRDLTKKMKWIDTKNISTTRLLKNGENAWMTIFYNINILNIYVVTINVKLIFNILHSIYIYHY